MTERQLAVFRAKNPALTRAEWIAYSDERQAVSKKALRRYLGVKPIVLEVSRHELTRAGLREVPEKDIPGVRWRHQKMPGSSERGWLPYRDSAEGKALAAKIQRSWTIESPLLPGMPSKILFASPGIEQIDGEVVMSWAISTPGAIFSIKSVDEITGHLDFDPDRWEQIPMSTYWAMKEAVAS
jgi:hypothetical protein